MDAKLQKENAKLQSRLQALKAENSRLQIHFGRERSERKKAYLDLERKLNQARADTAGDVVPLRNENASLLSQLSNSDEALTRAQKQMEMKLGEQLATSKETLKQVRQNMEAKLQQEQIAHAETKEELALLHYNQKEDDSQTMKAELKGLRAQAEVLRLENSHSNTEQVDGKPTQETCPLPSHKSEVLQLREQVQKLTAVVKNERAGRVSDWQSAKESGADATLGCVTDVMGRLAHFVRSMEEMDPGKVGTLEYQRDAGPGAERQEARGEATADLIDLTEAPQDDESEATQTSHPMESPMSTLWNMR